MFCCGTQPNHIHLSLLVWLQLPYFHGATAIFEPAIAWARSMTAGSGTIEAAQAAGVIGKVEVQTIVGNGSEIAI